MTLGKGRAEAITDAYLVMLAAKIGCHPADLEAISIVESNGFGWFKDGRIKILFEKHWFYKNLTDTKLRDAAVKAGLARKAFIKPSDGGYKDQSNADARYRLLLRAIALDEEAAFRSISMGKFQIMGFNYALCGFSSAKEMWEKFIDSERSQIQAFATFLEKKGLFPALRSRDFAKIETVYNGGGLNGAYARKMKAESDRLRTEKWKDWSPQRVPDEPPAPVVKLDPPQPSPAPVTPSPAAEDEPTPVPPPIPGRPPVRGRGIFSFLAAAIIAAIAAAAALFTGG